MDINNDHCFFTYVGNNIKKKNVCLLTREICVVLNAVYGCLIADIFSNGISRDYKLLKLRTSLRKFCKIWIVLEFRRGTFSEMYREKSSILAS